MTSVRWAGLVMALCGALGMVAPSPAAAGSIAGTVTAEGGGPIQGVEVCARPEPYSFEGGCAETNAGGDYTLDGLRAAFYYVNFYTGGNNLNYIPEGYDDKPPFSWSGDLVEVGADQNVTGIDAELEEGGVIKGVATDAETLGPAVGVDVCASSFSPTESFACGLTGADGRYEINALATGKYLIRFEGLNSTNYLSRYYDEAETPAGALRVPLSAGGEATGIDASLQRGAQIFGRVTEAGTGAAVEAVEVCVYDPLRVPSVEYAGPCTLTDAAGNYAIRSLPGGTYKVVFSQNPNPGWPHNDTFFEQWWNGASSVSEASALHLTPPQALTGIDAQLVNMIQRQQPVSAPASDPIGVTLMPQTKPSKCKKGFRKRKVKGKARCVRKHKSRHQTNRRKGGAGKQTNRPSPVR